MKKIQLNYQLLSLLVLCMVITSCTQDSLTKPQEEIPLEEELVQVHLDDSNWIELSPGVFVTPDYLESNSGQVSDRYYGNCPTCENQGPNCNCPSGWSCIDRDCNSSVFRQGGGIDWYSSGSINQTKYPFQHQRYADCTISGRYSCDYDTDNRFYYSHNSNLNDRTRLRVRYDGNKSWLCPDWRQPSVDYLEINGYKYIRVTTGHYCPTNNVRLVRLN